MRGGGVKVASFLGGLRSDANIHGGSTKESYTGGMGFDKGFHGCTGAPICLCFSCVRRFAGSYRLIFAHQFLQMSHIQARLKPKGRE